MARESGTHASAAAPLLLLLCLPLAHIHTRACMHACKRAHERTHARTHACRQCGLGARCPHPPLQADLQVRSSQGCARCMCSGRHGAHSFAASAPTIPICARTRTHVRTHAGSAPSPRMTTLAAALVGAGRVPGVRACVYMRTASPKRLGFRTRHRVRMREAHLARALPCTAATGGCLRNQALRHEPPGSCFATGAGRWSALLPSYLPTPTRTRSYPFPLTVTPPTPLCFSPLNPRPPPTAVSDQDRVALNSMKFASPSSAGASNRLSPSTG